MRGNTREQRRGDEKKKLQTLKQTLEYSVTYVVINLTTQSTTTN